jgi:hypothetical protein
MPWGRPGWRASVVAAAAAAKAAFGGFVEPFPYLRAMVPSALLAIVLDRRARAYCSMLSPLAIILLNALVLAGALARGYLWFLTPILIALGVAGFFLVQQRIEEGAPRLGWTVLAIVGITALISLGSGPWDDAHPVRSTPAGRLAPFAVGLAFALLLAARRIGGVRAQQIVFSIGLGASLLFCGSQSFASLRDWRAAPFPPYERYVEDGFAFLQSSPIPPRARVLTEDDMLYVILTQEPDRFARAGALQAVNVIGEDRRAQLFEAFDYVYLSKGTDVNTHPYYYLNYVPLAAWERDPFRLMIRDLLKTQTSQIAYGRKFVPVPQANEHVLVLRICAPSEPCL